MVYLCKFAAIVALALAAPSSAIDPNAIYDGGIKGNNGSIQLAIGNGGAGQSGLIKGMYT
jgi:hypothetical protein